MQNNSISKMSLKIILIALVFPASAFAETNFNIECARYNGTSNFTMELIKKITNENRTYQFLSSTEVNHSCERLQFFKNYTYIHSYKDENREQTHQGTLAITPYSDESAPSILLKKLPFSILGADNSGAKLKVIAADDEILIVAACVNDMGTVTAHTVAGLIDEKVFTKNVTKAYQRISEEIQNLNISTSTPMEKITCDQRGSRQVTVDQLTSIPPFQVVDEARFTACLEIFTTSATTGEGGITTGTLNPFTVLPAFVAFRKVTQILMNLSPADAEKFATEVFNLLGQICGFTLVTQPVTIHDFLTVTKNNNFLSPDTTYPFVNTRLESQMHSPLSPAFNPASTFNPFSTFNPAAAYYFNPPPFTMSSDRNSLSANQPLYSLYSQLMSQPPQTNNFGPPIPYLSRYSHLSK